jgi:uncharacterized membrane protein YfcA
LCAGRWQAQTVIKVLAREVAPRSPGIRLGGELGAFSSGHAPRASIGSVNTSEFFVTTAAATTFFVELGASPLGNLIPLVIGGLLAAPLGGWAVKHLPARALMISVGALVMGLASWQLARTFKLV